MLINIHTHHPSFQENIFEIFNVLWSDKEALPGADWHDCRAVSLGIHPWYIDENRMHEDLESLLRNAVSENVIFIGECGLDKLKGPDLDIQEKIFISQIKLAEKLRKPMVIHCVRAYNELMAIKRKVKPTVPMILHGFNKNKRVAQQLLNEGFFLSLGKSLLFSSNSSDILKVFPLDLLFFETDDSEEISIYDIYQKASEILNLPMEKLEEIIHHNFLKITQ